MDIRWCVHCDKKDARIAELEGEVKAKDEALANLRGSLASTRSQLNAESMIAHEASKRIDDLEEQLAAYDSDFWNIKAGLNQEETA